MTDKKILDEQELEKVTGGIDFTETKMPDNFYGAISKYEVENHKGENLYFVVGNVFAYGTVIKSEELFTMVPLTTRMHTVKVLATNRPTDHRIGIDNMLDGDRYQAYLGAEYFDK